MTLASLADLKRHVGIPVTDANDDERLSAALAAASGWVQDYCARTFVLDAEPSARLFEGVPGAVLPVDEFAELGGLVVEEDRDDDGTWSAVNLADVVPRLIGHRHSPRPYGTLHRLEGVWPCGGRRPDRVRVTARWGWPAVPEQVQQATLYQAAFLRKIADSPTGVLDVGEFGAVRASRVAPGVTELLGPFRRLSAMVA